MNLHRVAFLDDEVKRFTQGWEQKEVEDNFRFEKIATVTAAWVLLTKDDWSACNNIIVIKIELLYITELLDP